MQVNKKFGVIYADPNWLYANWTEKKNGAAVSHYETSSVDDICKIPVANWADKDCILVMCATLPKLPEAFKVAKAWGFDEYVTGAPWIKTSPNSKQEKPEGFWGSFVQYVRTGIGFWFQSTCELVLIFRKGKPTRTKRMPVKGILCGSEGVLFAPVKGHSAKPLLVYDWIQQTLKGPYLELFARNQIHGWTCWGGDLGYWLSENGVRKMDLDTPADPVTLAPKEDVNRDSNSPEES